MSNIKFQLSLNKHPKDCPNYSLVSAQNVRVSDDFSCLQSEESIVDNQTININLDDSHLILIDIIPCNKELVIFAKEYEDNSVAHILRYNEEDDIIVDLYQNLNYQGGRIIGTFTYNVNNELIIAFSEYSDSGAVPLKTINLGIWDGENTTSDELNFEDGKLALSPEVVIPKISGFDYISGTSYKGWYYYFIRYKINKNDYTRWFPIGYPIFVTTLELKNIFKYGLNDGFRIEHESSADDTITNHFILNGISDYISSKDDICNESVRITISDMSKKYNYFQIGFCCISKTYSKAFRTADIIKPSTNIEGRPYYNYIMDISNCINYTVEDLILNNYNYYNAKNVINYKNRLYISNYKEFNIPNITEEELSKIKLKARKSITKYISDVRYKDLNTNKEYENQETSDFVPANPILYLNNQVTITLLTGQQASGDFSDFTNCYINTNDRTKIYPIIISSDVPGRTGLTFVFLFFTIGDNTYSAVILTNNNGAIVDDAQSFNHNISVRFNFNYINTNNSFNKRKKQSTLIPGEIYNFYIHFVNKYGESTPGYRIPNTVKFKIENSNVEYFPINVDGRNYLLAPINQNIFNSDETLNKSGIIIMSGNPTEDESNPNTYIFTQTGDIDVDAAIEVLFNSSTTSISYIPNLKWYELFTTNFYPNAGDNSQGGDAGQKVLPFSYYINNNGDTLFRVPNSRIETDTDGSNDFRFSDWWIDFDLSNFTIPEGYIGYYFSYEKFESTNKINGILTKYDTFNQNTIAGNYKKYNEVSINNLKNALFYSSKLDIDDNIDLDCNILQIQFIKKLYNSDTNNSYEINSSELLSGQYPINYNNVELPHTNNQYYGYKYIYINDIKLKKAGKVNDGKFGIGTSLDINLTENQFSAIFGSITSRSFVKASLLKISKNIYTNENKVLIKFSNIFYTEFDGLSGHISNGLNGHLTYQGTLVYNYNKFIMSAENVILTEQYKTYYRCPVYKSLFNKWIMENRPPIAYIQQLFHSDSFYEAKSFKNEPEVLFQNLENIKDDEEQVMPFAANLIITPSNSIDVFQELQTNQDQLNPKTYLANTASRSYITQFDKRIQRSNVIADESLANSWRTFPLEGYRDISENKGKITNLIGIGTTLLVHTEHSLFAFDGSNSLKTGDNQDIKLTLPDIFDIDYTEVFTSDLGVCGLQDKEAWIVGQFGYIFYDNDAHRFYKFASKKIEIIDFDIIQLLNYAIPYKVRFAHDIERNRILIHFAIYDGKYNSEDIINYYTLSYNHQINKFISLHTYNFDKAVNTKNIMYLINENFVYCNKHDLNSINHNIQRRQYNDYNRNYGYYENGTNNAAKISVIVNDSYSLIKTIEFLTYKLFKRVANNNTITDLINERELSKVPYSGFKLRVHNDMCDSGEIPIAIDAESAKNLLANYDKPWWEFGNWNFNYFRDIKQGTSSHDIMSRIYGNYFIIDIIFYDDNNPYPQKIEFEDLSVKLVNDETV